ncbi:MAG: hydantoinase/oxoprolinase family protein, partial [Pseudomonadota bacterium]
KETHLRGFDPGEFVLFAAGGAGPVHCCGFGFHSGVNRITVLPFSAMYCTLGSSGMDVTHIYEQSRGIIMLKPQNKAYLEDYSEFNKLVKELQGRAIVDIRAEGFSPEELIFRLELEMKFGGQVHTVRVNSPRLELQGEEDVKAVCDAFLKEFSEVYGQLAMYIEGGIEIQGFILHGVLSRPKIELPTYPMANKKVAKDAFKGKRMVYWEEYKKFHSTLVIEQIYLKPGNVIEGPAIIESRNTNVVLPPGARITVDKLLNMQIERLG